MTAGLVRIAGFGIAFYALSHGAQYLEQAGQTPTQLEREHKIPMSPWRPLAEFGAGAALVYAAGGLERKFGDVEGDDAL